jgi:hypothetical protein
VMQNAQGAMASAALIHTARHESGPMIALPVQRHAARMTRLHLSRERLGERKTSEQ